MKPPIESNILNAAWRAYCEALGCWPLKCHACSQVIPEGAPVAFTPQQTGSLLALVMIHPTCVGRVVTRLVTDEDRVHQQALVKSDEPVPEKVRRQGRGAFIMAEDLA